MVLLMKIGAITATAVLSAEQGREPEGHPVLLTKAPTKPPLTEEQKAEAVEIVRKSGIVEKFKWESDLDSRVIRSGQFTTLLGSSLRSGMGETSRSFGSVVHSSMQLH